VWAKREVLQADERDQSRCHTLDTSTLACNRRRLIHPLMMPPPLTPFLYNPFLPFRSTTARRFLGYGRAGALQQHAPFVLPQSTRLHHGTGKAHSCDVLRRREILAFL